MRRSPRATVGCGAGERRVPWTRLLAVLIAGVTGACGGEAVVEPGVSLSFDLEVAPPGPAAAVEPGVADALAAADEVFAFVGAFEGGLDTLALLERIEERAVEDPQGVLAELTSLATVVHADWVPLAGDGNVRLSVVGPEGGAPVVVIVVVTEGRRILFAGASPPVVLRAAPPPRVEIALTPLAWDIEATVDFVTLAGPGSVGDLGVTGRFATGDPLAVLPQGSVEWRSLGPEVRVLDSELGTVLGVSPGAAAVEVANLVPALSMADDGLASEGKAKDTVLVQVGGT